MKSISKCNMVVSCLVAVAAYAAPAFAEAPTVPAGFTPLFDGYSLNGWMGDPKAWKVVDGAIVAKSYPGLGKNTFLIHNLVFDDFELRFKYRWKTLAGNSGVQFRSYRIEGDPGDFAVTGLQANVTDFDARIERIGMLYNETGDRQEMALLGQRAEITRRTATGAGTGRVVRTVHEMVNDRRAILDAIRNGPEWTEVVVVAYGNRIISAINGVLAFDALDNDPARMRDGHIALQLHRSHDGMKEFKPTYIEYKDIVIKPLGSAPEWTGRFKSSPSPAPEPTVTYKDSTRAGMDDVALPQ